MFTDELEEKPIEINVKMDYRGNLSINLYDYINDLSDEKKKELLEFGGWGPFVQDAMAKDIIDSFGSENYNSIFHNLRTALLNCDAMPEIIRMWSREMIELRLNSEQKEEYWKQAYRDLEFWVRQKSEDDYWRNIPKLPERRYSVQYPKEVIESAYEQAKEWGVLFPEKEESGND